MKKTALIALILAFGLLAAACGTSDDTTTTTAAVAQATTTTAPPADTTTTTEDPMADWPETIVYGFIPSERAETLSDDIQPYMDFLSEELGIEVEGVVTADYNGLVVAMGAGQADLGAFGPFGWVQAQELYPTLELLMQSIRRGSKTYHGQWFTNDPSICDEGTLQPATALVGPEEAASLGVADPGLINQVPIADAIAQQVGLDYTGDAPVPEVLEDGQAVALGSTCTAGLDKVAGKTVAFTGPTSTSGGVFPQLQLFNEDIDIENDIEYSYFGGSHTDTVAAVYAGDFEIGLSFDDARRQIRTESTDVGTKVIVFNLTGEIPNDIVAVRGELPDSLKQAIFDATAAWLQTDEGAAVFEEIYEWTAIQVAVDSDFDVVRDAAVKLGVSE
jgi:phosphonate transport system substrate-binding protein